MLAYLLDFGDTDGDRHVSAAELRISLAPFVPGPPANELKEAVDSYTKVRSRAHVQYMCTNWVLGSGVYPL